MSKQQYGPTPMDIGYVGSGKKGGRANTQVPAEENGTVSQKATIQNGPRRPKVHENEFHCKASESSQTLLAMYTKKEHSCK